MADETVYSMDDNKFQQNKTRTFVIHADLVHSRQVMEQIETKILESDEKIGSFTFSV